MQLNFKKFGETGKPLIILHGVFGLLDNWLSIGKTISEQGYQVFLVDQRNHGRSPEGPLDFPTLAEDLSEFIEQNKLEKPILIGHSMGGKTVMEYAVRYPASSFDALVVVDIGPKAYPIHHKKILEGLNAIPVDQIESRNEADEVLSEYEPILPVRQFLLKNLYRKDEGGFGWRFNLPVLTKSMGNVGAEITTDKPVKNPALFMRGAKSHYVQDEDWDEILKIFPAAKLETIEDAGHWVQAEKPKEFVSVLMNFLKAI